MPSPVTVTGTLEQITGVALPKAVVAFTLQNYGHTLPRIVNTAIIVQPITTAFSDSSGNISVNLWPNDIIDPSGTYYEVSIMDSMGRFYVSRAFTLASTTPTQDLSSIAFLQDCTVYTGAPGGSAMGGTAGGTGGSGCPPNTVGCGFQLALSSLTVGATTCTAVNGGVNQINFPLNIITPACPDTISNPYGCNGTHIAGVLYYSFNRTIQNYSTVTKIAAHVVYTLTWAGGGNAPYGTDSWGNVTGSLPKQNGIDSFTGWTQIIASGTPAGGSPLVRDSGPIVIWTGASPPALNQIHVEVEDPADTANSGTATTITVNTVELILYGSQLCISS